MPRSTNSHGVGVGRGLLDTRGLPFAARTAPSSPGVGERAAGDGARAAQSGEEAGGE